MRVAIVGSRDFPLLDEVVEFVRMLPTETIVVSGGARGVDITAERTARQRGLLVEVHRPNYDAYSEGEKWRAPLARNQTIVERADVIVAFWDGLSTGTKYTIDLARKLGKKVILSEMARPLSPRMMWQFEIFGFELNGPQNIASN